MDFISEKLIVFILLVLIGSSSTAVPILTEFNQPNKSIEENDTPESKEKVIIVSLFPNLEAYFQSTLQPGFAKDTSSQDAEISLDEVDVSSASKVSKIVFKNFQFIKNSAKKVSQYDTKGLSLELRNNHATKNSSKRIISNHNYATSNLDLELSGSLNDIVEKKVPKRVNHQPAKKFDLEMLKGILLDLLSPIPMLSLLTLFSIIALSSKRS